METIKVISADKATVVIQGNPQVPQNTLICDDGKARGTYHNTTLEEFTGQPKKMGVRHLMRNYNYMI